MESRELLKTLADDEATAIDVLPMLAAGFAHLGDFENALAMCHRSADLEPNNPEAHFGIAFYLRRLGYPASVICPPPARRSSWLPTR